MDLSDFYPRSPCGERPTPCPSRGQNRNFYPRSPCGERPQHLVLWPPVKLFLSTLSLRRATALPGWWTAGPAISIHALLAESDLIQNYNIGVGAHFYPRSPCGERRQCQKLRACMRWDFYPRSPCGERLQGQQSTTQAMQFLSTLSLRRATCPFLTFLFLCIISIHALLAESDLRVVDGSKSSIEISIHALLAESDGGTGG